ncbi:response regulator [Pleomorphovibrio marinus]|uniref:response regulator n=1 Tax=Pleomorphovibrio marinus TaxID=2164132 RepID=UPI000E0B2965|nr:response regulator [Pleomorphovibrio marinus]
MPKIKLVCIIDDDPLYIFGMKKILEYTSLAEESLFYKNGQEAIDGLTDREKMGEPFPNVILLDINMPIMNGWTFLEKFAEKDFKEEVKIFMVSSSIDKEEVDKAHDNSLINGYIFKPMTIEKIKTLKKELEEGF